VPTLTSSERPPFFGPINPDAISRPWYRRSATAVAVVVAAIIAVAVITDLPGNTTNSSNISEARSTIAEISTDVAPCNLGLTEAIGFYRDVRSGHITAGHRAQIPALIRDDYQACSYTNAQIVDLAGIDMPTSATGKSLNAIATSVLVWCDPDALAAIGAITTLIASPSNSTAASTLAKAERLLASDREHAYNGIASLAHTLGASMKSTLKLTKAPTPV